MGRASDPRLLGIQEPPSGVGATLRRLGPGVIIAGSIVGSGELIATTKVGAEAGLSLLWLILLGCVIKVFAQVEIGRHTIIWSETPLEALDRVPGPRFRVNWIVWYTVLMTALVVSQQGGIVGGVGQALAIWRPLTEDGARYNEAQNAAVEARVELALAEAGSGENIDALRATFARAEGAAASLSEPGDAYLWAVLMAIVTSILLYVGSYGLIQSLATLMVGLFTLVTLVTLVWLQTTDWAARAGDVLDGLTFSLPSGDGVANPVGTALAAFGIIGLGSAELLMYPYWCLEKGYARWTGAREESSGWLHRARGWVRVLQVDAWLSLSVYTLATLAFFMLGATVLWRVGLDPSGPEMIRTLRQMYVPVFGSWAQPVFLVGALAVLYSTFFVAAAGMSRLVTDLLVQFGFIGRHEETRERWTRRISTAWPLVAVGLFLFFRAPVAMVLASGTAQSVMLPMLGGAALYFRHRRGIAGLEPGRAWDLLLWASFLGFLVIAAWALYTLLPA